MDSDGDAQGAAPTGWQKYAGTLLHETGSNCAGTPSRLSRGDGNEQEQEQEQEEEREEGARAGARARARGKRGGWNAGGRPGKDDVKMSEELRFGVFVFLSPTKSD